MTEQEMGLLANKPAGAFVRSKCACKLLTVSREKFHSFLHLVPDFEQRVKAIAGMRAKQNEQLQAQKQAAKAMKEATFNAEAEAVLCQPRMQQRAERLALTASMAEAETERKRAFLTAPVLPKRPSRPSDDCSAFGL